TVVTDTCTYLTPILRPEVDVVLTNSAKWAYYSPANIGVRVILGSLEECVRSSVEGTVWRDEELFRDRSPSGPGSWVGPRRRGRPRGGPGVLGRGGRRHRRGRRSPPPSGRGRSPGVDS